MTAPPGGCQQRVRQADGHQEEREAALDFIGVSL